MKSHIRLSLEFFSGVRHNHLPSASLAETLTVKAWFPVNHNSRYVTDVIEYVHRSTLNNN